MNKTEYMTPNERNAIAGRFMIVSRSPVVVGFIGNIWPHDLSPAQLRYIKGFYQCVDYDHEILDNFPVSVNRSMYNGFMRFTPTKDIERGSRWLIEQLRENTFRATYQEYYSGTGWRTIGTPDICDRDYIENNFEEV